MRSLLALAMAMVLAGATAPVLAQTPATTPAANPQQERMKVCNEKATGMKGDERKNYMSACLSGKEPAKKLTASQQRMVDCNERATESTPGPAAILVGSLRCCKLVTSALAPVEIIGALCFVERLRGDRARRNWCLAGCRLH